MLSDDEIFNLIAVLTVGAFIFHETYLKLFLVYEAFFVESKFWC